MIASEASVIKRIWLQVNPIAPQDKVTKYWLCYATVDIASCGETEEYPIPVVTSSIEISTSMASKYGTETDSSYGVNYSVTGELYSLILSIT